MIGRRSQSIFVRLAVTAALLLALAVPVAGCGGDDDADADSLETSSLSKAQYVKQADKGCAQERRDALNRLAAYGERVEGGDPSRAYEVASRRIFAPSLERQADAIRSLGAPEGDEEQIEELLTELERTSATLVERPIREISSYIARLRPATELAREYGFSQCASSNLVV